MDAPALSPDGKRLAFISENAEGAFVLVAAVETGSVTARIPIRATSLPGLTWANADTLLLFAPQTIVIPFGGPLLSIQPFSIDLSSPEKIATRQLLLDHPRYKLNKSIIPVLFGSPALSVRLIGYERRTGRVLLSRWDTGGERSLYAVDAKTDESTLIDRGTRFTRDWVVDTEGMPIFRFEYTEAADRFRLLARRGDEWTPIAQETAELPELAVYGLDGARVGARDDIVVGFRPRDVGRYGLYAMSAETGEISRSLYAHPSADVATARIDPYTNVVVGADAADRTVWFDAGLAMYQAQLDRTWVDGSPRILAWSEDRKRIVVGVDRPERAPTYYLYDTKASTAEEIGSRYPALDGMKLASRKA
ncbi:MAG TPA: hypothetical protein VFV10_20710, partial [Gammaproteobacteria bacterium]|nr:hypothetical protein [Gammaproteobacteria bacterium]